MNNDYNSVIRPNNFEEFIGQKTIIDNLRVYIKAAKIKDTSLDHILLAGHAGVGKTSLAYLIAKELNQNIIIINANSIERVKDVIIMLSKLNEGDVLFIDEIHALNKNCEEVLYSAMEDFYINLNVKSDSLKEIRKFELPPFTLIGATTKLEEISKPLLDRFSITFNLTNYTFKEISKILNNLSNKLEYKYTNRALDRIASVSKLIPRIAINYLKRINDFALINKVDLIDEEFVAKILEKLGIKKHGLTDLDIRYLKMLHFEYKDKPVGINTITSYLNESKKTVEDIIEKYLIELLFIKRTFKGRVITKKGISYLHNNY